MAHHRLFRPEVQLRDHVQYDLPWIPAGWRDLISRLCSDLEPFVPDPIPEGFGVVQVKSKFGGLRFYTNGLVTEEFRERVEVGEAESFRTCEECGKPGKLLGIGRPGRGEDDRLRVVCSEHERALRESR